MKKDAIMHPKDAIEGYKDKLLDLYCESYGSSSLIALRQKFDNIYYCFESDPVTTLKFLEENSFRGVRGKDRKKLVLEANDYAQTKKNINNQQNMYLSGILLDAFYYNENILNPKALELDFACMGTISMKRLSDPNVSLEEKERIQKRQNKFLDKCNKMGVYPRKDAFSMSIIVSEIAKMQMEETIHLLNETEWGRRIKGDFWQNGVAISDEKLCQLFSSANTATANTWTVNGKPVVYLPLISRLDIGRLDEVFLHENRHAMEMNNNYNGLTNYLDGSYNSINEIRVEKHALRDMARLDEIFQNDISPVKNISECFSWYPYVKEFYESEETLLDMLAIDSDISSFEDIYSKELLMELDSLLHYIGDYQFVESFDKEIIKEKGKVLARKLIEHRNGVISR